MTSGPPSTAGAAALVLVTAWAGLLGSLAWHARARRSIERKRDPRSLVGLLLEGAAFAQVFVARDVPGALPTALPDPAAWATVALAGALLASSILLMDRSLRELGSQWRVVAAVAGGDRLVRSGPYARVRHPIYTAMGGMLVASGFLIAPPGTVLLALAIYGLGTAIRIRSEEGLLAERFGDEFLAYTREVPVVWPRWVTASRRCAGRRRRPRPVL